MSGPTIRIMGQKFHMSISQYIEAGVKKFQLILDTPSISEEFLKSWQFKIVASIITVSGTPYLPKTGNYYLTHSEWRIWSDSIDTIYKTMGQVTDIRFSVAITPAGDFASGNTDKFGEEIKEMTLCSVAFTEDIGSLFNNPECSDFTITCGDRSFFVHKAVLSARSDFFAAMFRSDMKETNKKEGKIEKMEPDIFELVLRYLYTSELPALPKDSLHKVYGAAERFMVEPLKIKCHSLFIDAVTTECKVESENIIESVQPVLDDQSEKVEQEVDDIKEREMLKNLFLSKEWRLFSEAFPHKAHEMCKTYLLQEL